MKVRWTGKASADLARLYDHLRPVAPEAAARVAGELARAPDRLIEFPRIGEKLSAYEPREVRRIIVGNCEMRDEIAAATIFVLRLWHCRENRSHGPGEYWARRRQSSPHQIGQCVGPPSKVRLG